MRHTTRLGRAYRRLYRWATRRLYHELAWAYELIAWIVSLGRWDAWRRQVLDHVVGEHILEIGFGTGKLMAAAARQGCNVTGVDPSVAMHRVAARTLQDTAEPIHRVRAVAQALPFAAQTFDTVLATFPTEYALDPTAIGEARRVLRTSVSQGLRGRLVMTGLGFRTEDSWMHKLLALVFGSTDEDALTWYLQLVDTSGFDARIVEDETSRVRVPVLVLEKSDDTPAQEAVAKAVLGHGASIENGC